MGILAGFISRLRGTSLLACPVKYSRRPVSSESTRSERQRVAISETTPGFEAALGLLSRATRNESLSM